MEKVNLEAISFVKEASRPRYTVSFDKKVLEKLRAYPFLGRSGVISPWDTITLTGEARERAGIPVDADFFAWAYPLQNMAQIGEDDPLLKNVTDSGLAFVIHGGFIYANNSLHPVGLNAVMGAAPKGEGLAFDGPHPKRLAFDGPHPLSSEMRSKLENANRFVPPTMPSLIKDGVIKFTWVEPSFEPGLRGKDGAEWRTGAFVYLYNEHKYDCFFRVGPKPA